MGDSLFLERCWLAKTQKRDKNWLTSKKPKSRRVTMAEKDPLQLSIRLMETAKSSLGMPRMLSRMFVSLFGCGAYIAAFVWIKIVSEKLLPPCGRLYHLLWTLYWLKTYSTNNSICSAFRIHCEFFWRWTFTYDVPCTCFHADPAEQQVYQSQWKLLQAVCRWHRLHDLWATSVWS